jgi:hypothetical protein
LGKEKTQKGDWNMGRQSQSLSPMKERYKSAIENILCQLEVGE